MRLENTVKGKDATKAPADPPVTESGGCKGNHEEQQLSGMGFHWGNENVRTRQELATHCVCAHHLL